MAEFSPMYPLGNYLTITQGYKSSHVGNDYGWTSRVTGGNHQPILSCEAGKVTSAVDGYGNTYPYNRIYGNYVVVSHGNGWYSMYAHLKRNSVSVKVGQTVIKGQQIGLMGNSGYSVCTTAGSEVDGQHLHFELRKGGNSKAYAVNPINYLSVQNNLTISDSTLYRDSIKIGISYKTVGSPVGKNVGVSQIQVISAIMNGRTSAGLSDDNKWKRSITTGYYNLDLKKGYTEKDGYSWYRLETNVEDTGEELWIAYMVGNSALYLVANDKDKEIIELQKKLEESNKIIENLNTENSNFKDKLLKIAEIAKS